MIWDCTARRYRWCWACQKHNISFYITKYICIEVVRGFWSCVSHPTHGAAAGLAHGIFTDCCDLGGAAYLSQAIIESKTTAHNTHMVMEILCAPDFIMASPLEPMMQWQVLPWHHHWVLVSCVLGWVYYIWIMVQGLTSLCIHRHRAWIKLCNHVGLIMFKSSYPWCSCRLGTWHLFWLHRHWWDVIAPEHVCFD